MQGSDAVEPLTRMTTRDRVVDQLRQRILDHRYEPGARLAESVLAQQFGLSRGPVREALSQLVQEGLLEYRPNRGVFIPVLTPELVTDIYVARAAIEQEAARIVADETPSRTLSELNRLVLEMSDLAASDVEGSWSKIVELDYEFHRVMVAGANSERLSRMFASLVAQMKLCLAALRPNYDDPAMVVSEHSNLLRLLRHGEADDAARAVREHMYEAVGNLHATESLTHPDTDEASNP